MIQKQISTLYFVYKQNKIWYFVIKMVFFVKKCSTFNLLKYKTKILRHISELFLISNLFGFSIFFLYFAHFQYLTSDRLAFISIWQNKRVNKWLVVSECVRASVCLYVCGGIKVAEAPSKSFRAQQRCWGPPQFKG